MRWKVLVTAPYLQPDIEGYRGAFALHGAELVLPPVEERMSESQLLDLVGNIDGVISGDDEFTEIVLTAAPRLRVISKWGTGIDSIDSDACARLGIEVRNVPGAFSQPVADTVVGYILCFARGLVTMDRAVKGGTWTKMPGRALHECHLGVIGVGNVGKAVVRRAVAFGMKVYGNDLVEMPETFLAETGIHMVTKERLLAEVDFVSVNCTLNPSSYHLLSEPEFELVKPNAVLVNTARGPIVDEPALVSALEAGRLAGAALDVFEHEPLPYDSPLRRMGNVLLAPHNANSSPRARIATHERAIANLFEVLERS